MLRGLIFFSLGRLGLPTLPLTVRFEKYFGVDLDFLFMGWCEHYHVFYLCPITDAPWNNTFQNVTTNRLTQLCVHFFSFLVVRGDSWKFDGKVCFIGEALPG